MILTRKVKYAIGYALSTLTLTTGLLLPVPDHKVDVVPDGYSHGRGSDSPDSQHLPFLEVISHKAEATCMALTVWGEARGSSYQEQLAYASLIYNRYADSRKSRIYAKSICDVVLSPHQFEPLNKKSSLRQLVKSSKSGEYWVKPNLHNEVLENKYSEILKMSSDLINGRIKPNTKATHVWSPKAQAALKRKPPFWVSYLKPLKQIGVSKFYVDYAHVNGKHKYLTKERPYALVRSRQSI